MMPTEPNGLLWLYIGAFGAFFWVGLGFWWRYLATLDVLTELRPNPADVAAAEEEAEVVALMESALAARRAS